MSISTYAHKVVAFIDMMSHFDAVVFQFSSIRTCVVSYFNHNMKKTKKLPHSISTSDDPRVAVIE